MKRNVVTKVTGEDEARQARAASERARGKTGEPDRPVKGRDKRGNGPPIKKSDGQVYGG